MGDPRKRLRIPCVPGDVDLAALRALIAKTEGESKGSGLNAAAVFGDSPIATLAVDAFDGSLDAATDLLHQVLPGWFWHAIAARSGAFGNVWHEPDKCMASHSASLPDNPARALLLAILRALESQMEGSRRGRGRVMGKHEPHFVPRLLPAPQAAHYLGVSESTLRGLGIPRRELGGKRLYDRLDLDAFADSLSAEPGPGQRESTCRGKFGRQVS